MNRPFSPQVEPVEMASVGEETPAPLSTHRTPSQEFNAAFACTFGVGVATILLWVVGVFIIVAVQKLLR